jgi:hypothetical protein
VQHNSSVWIICFLGGGVTVLFVGCCGSPCAQQQPICCALSGTSGFEKVALAPARTQRSVANTLVQSVGKTQSWETSLPLLNPVGVYGVLCRKSDWTQHFCQAYKSL